MLYDSRTSEDAGTEFDIVIVGGGPAGICLANELKGTGLRIALLESGGIDFDPDTQGLYEGELTGHADAFTLDSIRLRYLGGTSNHWGGYCGQLDPLDFERAPGDGLSGWPFPRATLDPFYARAHDYCDLGRPVHDPGAIPGFSRADTLMPDSDEVETRLLRMSPPTLFGEKYLETLRRAPDVAVWLNTNAVNLHPEDGDGLARVETRAFGGVERDFRGRIVVLACGAVENARLLLASNRKNGTAFGDAGGLLGRCYMDHPSGVSAFLHLRRPIRPGLYWNTGFDDVDGTALSFVTRFTDAYIAEAGLRNFQYYILPFPDEATRDRRRNADRALRGAKDVVKKAIGRRVPPQVTYAGAYCDAVSHADDFIADLAHRGLHGEGETRFVLKYESEQRPARDNAVSLMQEKDALGQPRARLHWAPSEDDIASIQDTARRFGEAVGAADIGRVRMEDHDDEPFWGISTAWHQLGTTRMAVSETGGVTDPDARVHGTRRLFVAGGSLFPTSGRVNPTLTIVALAIRLADHLKQEIRRL